VGTFVPLVIWGCVNELYREGQKLLWQTIGFLILAGMSTQYGESSGRFHIATERYGIIPGIVVNFSSRRYLFPALGTRHLKKWILEEYWLGGSMGSNREE